MLPSPPCHRASPPRLSQEPKRNGTEASHSTLSFSWVAEHADDSLYFAMCYPYSYSDLRAYLARLQADPLRARHVRRQRLALTIAGNECEMLWVTDHASPAEAVNARPVVALSARVHPGESNASWVMQASRAAQCALRQPATHTPRRASPRTASTLLPPHALHHYTTVLAQRPLPCALPHAPRSTPRHLTPRHPSLSLPTYLSSS